MPWFEKLTTGGKRKGTAPACQGLSIIPSPLTGEG